MHIASTKAQLAAQLSLVIGASDARATVPMLSTVLLKTLPDNRLSLLCSDTGVVARSLASCEAIKAPGELAVDAKRFNEIVRAVPDDATIELKLDTPAKAGQTANLLLKAGRSRFRLPVFAANDYPKMVTEQADRMSISLSSKRLAELIDQVAPAMGVNDVRPYLNGTLCIFDDKGLSLVSTDGFRLAIAHEAISGMPETARQAIIPRKSLLLAKKLLGQAKDAAVTLTLGPKDVQFAFPDGNVLLTRCLEGVFPDYKRVLPTATTLVEVPVPTLRNTLTMMGAAMVVTADSASKFRVDIDLKRDTLVIRQGDASRSEVDCTMTAGEEGTISINLNFLRDAIDACGNAERLLIGSSNERSPVLVRPVGADFPLNVIMPMKA